LRAARDGRLPQIGDGANLVDVTHVDDVVQAVECALTSDAAVGQTFLITGGEHVPLWEMIRALLTGVGIRYPTRRVPLPVALAAAAAMESIAVVTRREPTLTRYAALILARTQTYDISRARTLLGFSPTVTASQGISRTVDALRHNSIAP
jgi:nucleoside-diphosphate-sugar epimerase